MWDCPSSGANMRQSEGGEERVTGSIVIEVEAAPHGRMRYTLDADDRARRWVTVFVAHDDRVIGGVTLPEQTAHLLVRGGVASIRRSIPSLEVGGVSMRPEPGPEGNAQIIASGTARFLHSEWEAVLGDIDGPPVI